MLRASIALPFVLALCLLIPITADAEGERELSLERADFARHRADIDHVGGLVSPRVPAKGIVAPVRRLLPFIIDDTTPDGTTTLLSVRHAAQIGVSIDVTIAYYDTNFTLIASEIFTLAPDELASRNLELVPGLPTPDAVTRGFAIVGASNRILVDFFQLDEGGNFATGSHATLIDDFCDTVLLRFLRFGIDDLEGSKLLFIVDGPRGSANSDRPTVVGEVFSESGGFLNSFTIREDEWMFERAAADLVLGSDFGTMRLSIDGEFGGGAVYVVHSAFGRFSVGLPGACEEIPLL